ncbi:MAG: UDP-N-acetylmuramoyl-L-alanyl-D-glutamate--2,6-diaminopimelate ligase [Candidatus Coatesbacteria bacterium]|nr:UDP-N-acetylmuramoyl-L-alanyl-D-glutamate--2,6-diaminopimelate ligase [Candidatus Coatesbacteria bacterium]
MNLAEIRDFLKLPTEAGNMVKWDKSISDIIEDSRCCTKNSLFIAEVGNHFNGHSAILNLYQRGVHAFLVTEPVELPGPFAVIFQTNKIQKYKTALAHEFYKYPWRDLVLIGITGTNGKTTTAHLIQSILKEKYGSDEVGIMGTIRYAWGRHEEVCPLHTTPGILTLLKYLRRMVNDGCKVVVMEVSSHALKLGRVDDILYDVGIFTNLTQDHFDFHTSWEDYYQSKKRLFLQMKENGRVVLNKQDKYGERLYAELDNISEKISFDVEGNANVSLNELIDYKKGLDFKVKINDELIIIKSSLLGLHNIENILGAIATAKALDISLSDIQKGIENLKEVVGRFQIYSKRNINAVVDYAHSPNALENVLKAINKLRQEAGLLITVFGCGGERDKEKRPIMGKIAQELSDFVFITSDNPRNENPLAIINDIKKGMSNHTYEVIVDRREAIKKALTIANPGDWILIAGKGHENYQLIGNQKIFFDDMYEVRKYWERYEEAK